MPCINKRFNDHILLLMILILSVCLHSCTAWTFGKETNKTQKIWKTANHEIRLVLNQAWSGPANYRYLLYKRSMFKKKLAISYSGTSLDDDDSCAISFMPLDSFDGPTTYTFDKCKIVVIKVEQKK